MPKSESRPPAPLISDWKRIATDFPTFRPARWIGNGHAQTLGGVFLPYARPHYRATRHQVVLDDGDRCILHDDCPPRWKHGGRVVLMIHGLTGSFRSGYLERTAAKLNARGYRTFRMDLRGCGAGSGLARLPYHSGRSDDAAAAIREIARVCPGSPLTLVGFSLGGNISLKLLGEVGAAACGGLDSGISVCPPVDLAACAEGIGRFPNSIYNRHFVKSLLAHVGRVGRYFQANAPMSNLPKRPKCIVEFDDLYTAPLSGFGDARSYYRECSGLRFMHAIRKPTLIMAAENDPMIPPRLYAGAKLSAAVDLRFVPGGGHLGFIARRGIDPDPRWMDWRIVDWISRWDDIASKARIDNDSRVST